MKFNSNSILKAIAARTRTVQLTLGIMAGITIGLGVQVVTAWTGPTATPPEENVEAPITVKLNSQFKQGSLWLNTGTDISTGDGALANGLIVAQGKVGIGTLSPNAKLEINSNTVEANVVLSSFSPRMGAGGYQHATDMLFWNKKDSKYWVLGTRGSSGLEADGAHIAYCGSSNPDGSCNTEWKRPFNLTPEGNVGIGVVSPNGSGGVVSSAKTDNIFSADLLLDVFKGDWLSAGDMQIRVGDLVLNSRKDGSSNIEAVSDRGANGNLVIGAQKDIVFNTQTAGVDVMEMSIKNNGNVGIGLPSPTYKLDVNGTIRSSDGVLHTSDIRLKRNIQLIQNPLEKILDLRGVTYHWKDENKSQDAQIGLIAQEVEQEFPEVVFTDEKGMKSVNYASLVAPLIEAVKEQQQEIQMLKEMVKVLQEKS